jgi:hypothetical protein
MDQAHESAGGRRLSRVISAPAGIFLILILLAEIWVFSGSFRKFFTHDSLFYMTNVPKSLGQFLPYLTTPSTEKSYRPLNLGLVALLRPFLGVDPRPYHWIPIIFHLLNTWLFYALAKRIFADGTAALAAAAFWGLHSVAGWITYDITYLSDFLLAFLLLVSLLLAVDGYRRKSRLRIAASLAFFVMTLMTKEAATTFPLAVWISLGLADLRASGEPATWKRVRRSFRNTLPLTLVYFLIACAFAGLFAYWVRTGEIYDQGTSSAYAINPWTNLAAKARYLFWAFNLPDALSIPNPGRNRMVALALMGVFLVTWIFDILRRRARLEAVEWAGLVWFIGLNIPAFLLSQRLAKWYLYIPLFGLALAFGIVVRNLRDLAPGKARPIFGLALLIALIIPVLFSTRVQTRSYIASSDSSYQSDLLQSCLNDVKSAHPKLPPQATLYFLPAFEEGVSAALSAPPIDHGELFSLYYPDTRLVALFAHKGQYLPVGLADRDDIFVFQYFDRHLYDVTQFFKAKGRMTLFLLPTAEGEGAPLLKKTPAGGWDLYNRCVQVLLADRGDRLPDDYSSRSDLWILQYLNGRFSDVTDYYKGRHRDGSLRVIRSLTDIRYSINRAEFFPDYEHFQTPTGAPVFFQGGEKEIFTQLAATTVTVPLHRIPSGARLRFDISWMYELGDGGWAEASLRKEGKERVLYREYMKPDSRRTSLLWKEKIIDLQAAADWDGELILRCYNDQNRTTIGDWLNWRDIVIETPQISPPGSR